MTYLLVPDNACKGCVSFANELLSSQSNITGIVVDPTSVDLSQGRVWVDSTRLLNRLAITAPGPVLVTVEGGEVVSVESVMPVRADGTVLDE
jgi:hypothetical protein